MQQAHNQSVTKWVEVKAEEKESVAMEPANSMNSDTNLYIEFYGLNMTVGNGYPIESLISLLREVCAA